MNASPPVSLLPSPASADPLALLLADKRSEATRRAYRSDLALFFGQEPTPEAVQSFVARPTPEIALALARYKGAMLAQGLSEATVNRRLAAVRSLLKLCYRLGYARTDGRGLVDGEKVRAYRDTRGLDLEDLRRLVRRPDTGTIRGLRDAALLRLLCENALRRQEVCATDVADFDAQAQRLAIRGKGRGTQKEGVTLSTRTAGLLVAYLVQAGHWGAGETPLFRSLDRRPGHRGGRLTPDGLHEIVRAYGRELGLFDLSPHRLRHAAITAALDATGGDVRRVHRLSRHADLRTLSVYDDNRQDLQGEVTRLLSGML